MEEKPKGSKWESEEIMTAIMIVIVILAILTWILSWIFPNGFGNSYTPAAPLECVTMTDC